MTKWIWLGLALALSLPLTAGASEGRHTVVGMLSMKKGEPGKLVISSADRQRFVFQVENAAWVLKHLKKADFFGLVRVEMDVLPKLAARSPVNIIRVERVHVRRVPRYDSDFKAVANGNG